MVRARRSCLAVPASARTLARGPRLAVDEVVIDLEDSVPAEHKKDAREAVVAALAEQDWEAATVSVRINALATEWGAADVAALAGAGGRLDCVVVPKVESAAQLLEVAQLLSAGEGEGDRPVAIEALIETAAGLLGAAEIAAGCERLEALILGPADLAASLGLPDAAVADTERRWEFARWTLLLAARAAGVQAIDGPCLFYDDAEALRESAAAARALGYDGKWAIHPSQVETLERSFTPDPGELARARAILDALAAAGGRGAVALDGEMIDEASRVRAEQLLARAR